MRSHQYESLACSFAAAAKETRSGSIATVIRRESVDPLAASQDSIGGVSNGQELHRKFLTHLLPFGFRRIDLEVLRKGALMLRLRTGHQFSDVRHQFQTVILSDDSDSSQNVAPIA